MKHRQKALILTFISAMCFFVCIGAKAQDITARKADIGGYSDTFETLSEQTKNITYTINLTLHEADKEPVTFTIYVKTDSGTFSKKGVVASGEKSVKFEFDGLPLTTSCRTSIVFDNHKYKNAVLDDFYFISNTYAHDFKTDFTPEYSRSVICNVSLPNDFAPNGDVEIKVQLSKYLPSNSVSVVDELTDWTDSRTITLNSEKRSEQICLYNQASASCLSYKLLGDANGLCQKGYLRTDTVATSDKDSAMQITENLSAELQLLCKKEIAVTVYRPFSLSIQNDIFATVVLNNVSYPRADDTILDFTKTPIIASGKNSSQFKFELAEDEVFELMINSVTGDEHLSDYCYLVSFPNSTADKKGLKKIDFSSDNISITLPRCNNVTGTTVCTGEKLYLKVFADCTLSSGNTICLSSDAVNGTFSLKIPEDTDTYILYVQASSGKKSYYVSDGISTNDKNKATKFEFEYNDDKSVVLEYIVQNPTLPIEISNNGNRFKYTNVSDYIKELNTYIAYYDSNKRLISVDKTHKTAIPGSSFSRTASSDGNYKIKKVKAFAWGNDSITPLGNTSEINVNQPSIPEPCISVFKLENSTSVLNGKQTILAKAPELINDTVYISITDFEKLGYKTEVYANGVYIENEIERYKLTFGEYTALQTEDNIMYEISAPILLDGDDILVPVSAVSNLFGEKAIFDSAEKTAVISMPFDDIACTDTYFNAVVDMYNRGIITGYEDSTFRPDETVLRSETALYFSRAMGHEFWNYEFECSDVADTHWAKSVIGICINENVFKLENDNFRPNDNITLREALNAALEIIGGNTEYSEDAKKSILLVGINENNTDRDITRSEFVQLLYNLSAS